MIRKDLYQNIFHFCPTPSLVLIPDTPKYTIVEINKSYQEIFGNEKVLSTGKGFFEIFPEGYGSFSEEATELRASFESVISTGKEHKTGPIKYYVPMEEVGQLQKRYWEAKNTPLFDEYQNMVYIIHSLQEVTQIELSRVQLSKAENRLAKNRQKLSKILNHSLDVICTIDTEGIFKEVSTASEKVWGYHPDELKGKSFKQFIFPGDYEHAIKEMDRLIKKKELTSFESRYIRKDGNLITMVWSAKWDETDQLIYCVVQDGTKIKEAERKLLRNERRYSSLVQAGYDLISILDKDGNYDYISPNSKSILGVSPEELIGKCMFDSIHYEDCERIKEELNRLEKNKSTHLESFRVRHADGQWRRLETTATNRLDNPSVAGIVTNSRDVTEKIHYLELEKLEKSVLEMNSKKEYTLQDILDFYLNGLAKIHYGALFSVFEHRKGQLFNWSSKSLPVPYLEAIEGLSVGMHTEPSGVCTFKKEKVIVTNIMKSVHWKGYKEVARDNNLHACWSYPIPGSDQKVLAAFSVYFKNPRTPTAFENNSLSRVCNILQIIIDNKQNEKALKDSIERYQYVSIATSDAIWDWDLLQDRIYWGVGFENLFGHKIADIKADSSSWTDFLHPKDSQNVLSHIYEVIDGEKTNWEDEYRFLKANGEYSYVHDRGFVVRDKSGKAIRMVGAIQDISREKRQKLEDQLKLSLSTIFSKEETMEAAFQQSLREILAFAELDYGEIWMTNIDNSHLFYTGYWSETESVEPVRQMSFQKAKGFSGKVWTKKTPKVIDNLQTYSSYTRKTFARKNNLVSLIAYPILFKEEIIAVLILYSKNKPLSKGRSNNLLSNTVINQLAINIQRKKAEFELNLIFDLSPDLLCIVGMDGFFKKINNAFTSLLGYTEEYIKKTSFYDFIHPEDRESIYSTLALLKSGQHIPYYENRYLTKSGQYVWLAWTSAPLLEEGLVFAIAKDITEKKKAEFELLQFKKTIESAKDSICIVSIDRKYQYVNPSFVEKLGYTINDFKHKKEKHFVYADKTRAKEVFNSLFKGNYWQGDVDLLSKQGKTIHFHLSAGPILDDKGELIAVFGIHSDISERKLAEVRLRELNESLEIKARELTASNKELEQFAFIASHDLQEPLRMVTNFLNLLQIKHNKLLDKKGKQYIHFAIEGAKRMRQIILDLLDFSRVGRIDISLEELDLNGVIEDIILLQKNVIDEKNAKITWDTLPVIYGEKTSILQLFQNLIQNGIKYHRPGKVPEIHIRAKEAPDHWYLTIRDNGIGISPEYFDKIFIIFQRLHSLDEYSGTGIGLAICKKIVEKHGGKIWVTSEENRGSTFHFTLTKP